MSRRDKASGKTEDRRRKTAKVQRPAAAAAILHGEPSDSDLRAQLELRTRELREAQEQQAATAEVLRVISSSPGELAPVFQAMLENATRICEAQFGTMYRYDGDAFHVTAMHNAPPAFEAARRRAPIHPPPGSALAQTAATKQIAHVHDIRAQLKPHADNQYVQDGVDAGYRTLLTVPMLKNDELIGTISIFRPVVRPFTDKQIELVQNFAAQAVIAIENTRLLSELRESLERQTATSEVLSVIASSPGKLEPVFQTMLENAIRLCGAKFGTLFLYEKGQIEIGALAGVSDAVARDFHGTAGKPPVPGSTVDRMIRTRKTLHIDDLQVDKAMARTPVVRAGGRSYIGVPLLKEGEVVGALGIYRMEVRPFTDSELALVVNFAAQAVIAIENARLLSELRQRTDDLSESLEQQTATSDVLGVISSSPGELEPVFNSILENAVHICEASFGNLLLYDDDVFRHVALHNAPQAWADEQLRDPVPPRHAARVLYGVVDTKQVTHIADMAAENPDEPIAIIAGARTVLIVPMLKENALIGVIAIYRKEVRPFTAKQIELVSNFAAQAVIAIENTRLLNELRQRTGDLSESLEQQTATSDVLRIISSSPGELEPVFQAMLTNAVGICRARFGNLLLFDGSNMRVVAMHNAPRALEEARRRDPVIPLERSILGPLVRTKKLIHVEDITAEEPYASSPLAKAGGARTALGIPMLRDNELVGAIAIYHQDVRPFSDKQIELLSNFAAQAVIAIENTRLLSELRESLAQQTATSEVLSIISSSPGDLQPVFDAMLANATRLCEAKFASLVLCEGDRLRRVGLHNAPPAFVEIWRRESLIRPHPESAMGRVTLTKQVAHMEDIRTGPAYLARDPIVVAGVELGGYRSVLSVPMLKEDALVGIITIYRQEVRPFADKQIELVSNFAAQAVIAIENTRLLNELRQRTDDLSESLEQQTATSEVLKVISSSPGELKPVFNAMLENATRICQAQYGMLFLWEGAGQYRVAAMHGAPPSLIELRRREPLIRPAPASGLARVVAGSQAVQIADVLAEEGYVHVPPGYTPSGIAVHGGARTELAVPMLKDGNLIGTIVIYRTDVRPFADKQIALVQNFAAQAVIAIENTRLLNELRQRTDDLTESLEQQTATSEVLKVISSSPGQLGPVFDAMLENAARICEASFGTMMLFEGEKFRRVAIHNAPPEYAALHQRDTLLDRATMPTLDRLATTKQVVHTFDMAAEEPEAPITKFGGARTLLTVPMLKDDELVGAIGIFRQEVRPFTGKQIELVQNFAAQAVIAIENARLLSELRERTDDLSEALEQQTATSEVLKVISSSPGDLEPVFKAMLENATRICEAKFGVLFRYDNGRFLGAAGLGWPPALAELNQQRGWFPPLPGSVLDSVSRTNEVVHNADDAASATPSANVRLGGARSTVGVPMLKDDELIGAIVIYRQEVRPFNDKQIELVTNFAAQAVIAIENARLLNELRQRTDDLSESLEQQTATSEVLKVISSSPGDLNPVFEAMLENAVRICGAKFGALWLYDGKSFRAGALHNVPDAFTEFWERGPHEATPASALARVVATKSAVRIADVKAEPGYAAGDALIVAGVELARIRSFVVVPMLKEGGLIGAIGIYQQEVRPFRDKQVELVTNFAAQAVIAIENARLLNELRQRTDDLSESLEQQTATSEVLKVISSSPGMLAPVFQAMLENATRICEAKFGVLWLSDGPLFRVGAMHGVPKAFADVLTERGPIEAGEGSPLRRVMNAKGPVHTADELAEPRPGIAARYGGARSLVAVPMRRDNELVGAFIIYRQEVRPFTDKQIELVTNFAAQAVIAIENTRLLNELRQRTDDLSESLEQQTATSEVLKVISSSPGELEPVFEAMLANAVRICGAKFGTLHRFDGKMFEMVAGHGTPPAMVEFQKGRGPFLPASGNAFDRMLQTKRVCQIADAQTEPTPGVAAKLGGARSQVIVPMLKDDELVGAIIIYRQEVRPFTDKQVELVTNFAAQAVIAIENTRLLSELRQRTDDLSESLEQQTATSEVLQVISSSPGELEPVFQAMLQNATQICEAKIGILFRYEDGAYNAISTLGVTSEYAEFLNRGPVRPGPATGLGRVASTMQTVHIEDTKAEPAYADREPFRVATAELGRARTLLNVPMIKDGELIGAIGIYRQTVRPFSDKQIELVTNFAAQAVIAIENTRLLSELRESLQQQTATADVLKVISRSTFDLQTVLDTLVESAARLCRAERTAIRLAKDGLYHNVASYGFLPEHKERMEREPLKPDRGSMVGRVVLEGKPVHIDDSQADANPGMVDRSRSGGTRTMLGVPLLREGTPIGVLLLQRGVVQPFTEKQIELVSTFADQAVIAIENVRLFDEIQDKSRQLAEASQHKSQFLANMSHELRTPLNAIIGYTELIIDGIYGETPDKALTVLKRVESNGRHLLGLINDVLDFSKIEAGQLKLAIAEYSMKDVVYNVFSAVEPLATKKNLKFKVEVPPDMPAGQGDERKLTQVLLNLVGNAIKFTDAGEVTIKVAPANGEFSVAVHDTGPGIPLAAQDKLFEEFQQADNSITKVKGGTGLGLAIARRIVEMHGGRLWLDSSPGNGSVFTFTVPSVVESARPS